MFETNETLEQARERNVRDALAEDIGTRDWTAMLVPEGQRVRARVVVREDAVLCGHEWFAGCLRALDSTSRIDWQFDEGEAMPADAVVCTIEADARALLSAERPALNFLQLLSGTATVTRRHVEAIAGASPNPRGCAIMDTRKTLPGLRQAQKYAVRVGGGRNQRLALWHGILIKENHIAAAGSIRAAVDAARAINSKVMIEVEVENLDELQQALEAQVDRIMLDNFTLDDMRRAVLLTRQHPHGTVELEASGNMELERLREVAETGVDFISVGALTKHVKAVDLSMRMLEAVGG